MSVQGETREKIRIDIREPRHYKVIMHNDDFTTMDFVVDILRDIFHKDETEAERLMLLVQRWERQWWVLIRTILPCPRYRRQRLVQKRKGFRFG